MSEVIPIDGDKDASPVVVSFAEAKARIVSSPIPSSAKRKKVSASTLKAGSTISAKVKISPTSSASSSPKTSTRSSKHLRGQGSSSAPDIVNLLEKDDPKPQDKTVVGGLLLSDATCFNVFLVGSSSHKMIYKVAEPFWKRDPHFFHGDSFVGPILGKHLPIYFAL